jgi:hypothetical protein
MTTRRLHLPILLALALLAFPAAANASDWSWSLTLYGWGSDIKADIDINDREVIDAQVDFEDLLDDLDFGFMFHLEGRRGKHGLFADFYTVDLGDEPRIIQRPNLPFPIQAESDLEITIIELGGVYYPGGEGGKFGVAYGVRMIDSDQEIDILLVGGLPTDRRIVDVTSTLYDGMLGVRYSTTYDSGWSFALWGDVAGGGTDFGWSAAALLGYDFGQRDQYAVRFGYRAMEFQFEEDTRGARVETDLTWSGGLIGFTFRF